MPPSSTARPPTTLKQVHPSVASTSRLPPRPAPPASATTKSATAQGKVKAIPAPKPRKPPPPTAEEQDASRRASTLRLKSTWADIMHRHESVLLLPPSSSSSGGSRWHHGNTRSLPVDEDDIIDLGEMKIVQDRGVLRGARREAFTKGSAVDWEAFYDPEAELLLEYDEEEEEEEGGGEWEDEQEEEGESEDEIAAFDQIPSLPAHSFTEQRRKQEAERQDRLDFLRHEEEARLVRRSVSRFSSVGLGAGAEEVDDVEWEAQKRKLGRGLGNEVLDLPVGMSGILEEEEEEEDEFAVFEVTPTTGRTLPRSQGALAAARAAKSTGKNKVAEDLPEPPSSTRALRHGLRDVRLSSSPAAVKEAPASRSGTARAATVKPCTSSPLRHSLADLDSDPLEMPPPPLPTSRSLPNLKLATRRPATSSPLTQPPSSPPKPPSTSSPLKRSLPASTFFQPASKTNRPSPPAPARSTSSPTTTDRRRRESSIFVGVVVPSRSPRRRKSSADTLAPAPGRVGRDGVVESPRRAGTRLPPSPEPEEGRFELFGARVEQQEEEEVSPRKRGRGRRSMGEEEKDEERRPNGREQVGLPTPPLSKGSTAARRSPSMATTTESSSPRKNQRRSSPVKALTSAAPSSTSSPGMFSLVHRTAALQVASPPESASTPARPSRRRSSSRVKPSPARSQPAEEEEEEDELLLTPSSARAQQAMSKPERVEQSLEGVRLGRMGMGWSPTGGGEGKEWEVVDLTGESDDELDCLGGGG